MGGNVSVEEQSYSVEEKVPYISKRTIGKLMVKYCGNEGHEADPTLVVSLRRILQATITKLDSESEETWKNAEVVIYDQLGNDFCIRSGEAENKFVVQLDEKDQINIMCTRRQRQGVISWLTTFLPSRGAKQSEPSAIEERTVDSKEIKESQLVHYELECPWVY